MLLAGGCVFCRNDCCCWVESVLIVGFHVFGEIVVCGRLERVFMVVVCLVGMNLCSWWIYVLLLERVLVDTGKNLLLLERMCAVVGKSMCLGRNLCYCWQDSME